MTFEKYLGQVPGFTDFVSGMPNVLSLIHISEPTRPY